MDYRPLGNSGLRISEISYGNWITHGGQVEDDLAVACVHRALELGVTTFDTADVYAGGRAESVLGRALAGVPRHDLEIFTKVYWPTGAGVNDRGLSRKHILKSIDASLGRLGVEYVDLYQAHRYDYATPLEETMTAFADIVRAGKAHYIGVSEWTADQIRAGAELARDLNISLVSSQPQYSMLWRVIEAEVIPACEVEGLSQIVWSPIAQGVLTGKYLPGAPLPEDTRATDDLGGGAGYVRNFLRDSVLEAVQRLKPIAAEAGLSMAQLAIAWVLSNDNVASAIVGASRPEQLDDNLGAVGHRLDADTLAAIDVALGDVVITDPKLTTSPNPRP
jgi:aryl-alcohol dehydrogenase-like predicted oxidoreductase